MSEQRIGVRTLDQWDLIWPEIFDHYQQDLRHAHYVNAFLTDTDERILEIGAGSFRDMALLNRVGVNCSGMDFSYASVKMAKFEFPNLADKIFQGDAFNLSSVPDKAFDVSFHNGFWALFGDNEISRLVIEQARVSRYRVMATVHNAHNPQFVEYFAKLAEENPLYQIRFFEVGEIQEHLLKVCRSVVTVPVGKGKKYHEDAMINQGTTSRAQLRNFLTQAGMEHLAVSERLLCIGQL